MRDDILSILKSAPTSRFIYSSLSFHASSHGGELPGSWFARALAPLGIEESAVRQTLYRMEREGALSTRREGRTKMYAATATTRAIIEAGTAKMLASPETAWDGAWTLVHFRFDNESRELRDRLRDVLRVEGFAALGPGLYVHPRHRVARLRAAAAELDAAGRLQVFRGSRIHPRESDGAFAARLWDLEGIAARYRRFLAGFRRHARRGSWPPREAAALRFALVFEFLEVAWDDPELAPALLSARWPGDRARRLVRELYERLTPAALAYGEEVMERVARSRPNGDLAKRRRPRR